MTHHRQKDRGQEEQEQREREVQGGLSAEERGKKEGRGRDVRMGVVRAEQLGSLSLSLSLQLASMPQTV